MDDITIYDNKLTKVLEEFLKVGYKIENDTYIEILLSHLSGRYDTAVSKQLLKLPIFTKWIEAAITTWEQSPILPEKSIQTFCLNLISLISTDEIQFIKLEILDIFVKMCTLFKVQQNDTCASVKLGYVRLLTAFLDHESGIKWIIKTKRWTDMLQMSHDSQTVYVVREAQMFFLKLFTNCFKNHSDLCDEIFKSIVNEVQYFNSSNTDQNIMAGEIEDEQLQTKLTPILNLINYVLDKIYLNDNIALKQEISKLLKNYPNLETNIWSLLNITHDTKFHLILSTVLTQIYFADLLTMQQIEMDDIKVFCVKLYTFFHVLINKNSVSAFFHAVRLSHIYWKQQIAKMITTDLCKSCVFENQMIIFQIMPMWNVSLILDPKCMHDDDEFLEEYVMKLFKISCEHTIRLAYRFRDALQSQKEKAFEIAIEGTRAVMETRKYFDRDRAVIVFQSMMYVLRDVAISVNKNQCPMELITSHNGFLAHILEGLATLITEFSITWRESVETIGLMSLSVDLLNSPNLSYRLAVLSLKLIQLSIDNFMPPNLALLVDSCKENSVSYVGPLLRQRLHDINWEIRDSALEVLHSIIVISEYKYPPFQRLILDHQLCSLVVSMAMNDSESYVRNMALKCITAMIQIDSYWRDVLEKEDLPVKMINILRNETEGIVRREAVTVITQLYYNERISKDIINDVYSTMSMTTVSDLHWEVKVNAIKFWKKVICKQLSNQGMIDGSFPNVTFSKENRKIVSLTEQEILNRINKVLTFLADVNCLTVLILSLYDDCDLIVVETALEVIEQIEKILRKYNIMNSNKQRKHSETVPNIFDINENTNLSINSNKFQKISVTQSDETIESIIRADDVTLLANVYKNKMKVENGDVFPNEMMIVDSPANRKITTDLFIDFLLNKNPQSIYEERNKWVKKCENNLESLLDDILKSYETSDVNRMDCY